MGLSNPCRVVIVLIFIPTAMPRTHGDAAGYDEFAFQAEINSTLKRLFNVAPGTARVMKMQK